MKYPKISALFSTFNRADLLREALLSLTRQTLPQEDFEVVVIDDGSSDHTSEVVASFKSVLPLRYSYQTNHGLAEGKNHGIRIAGAPILVFMDDDDVASPYLLEEHLKSHYINPDINVGVLGYTDLLPKLAKNPLMHFVTEVGCYMFSYARITEGETLNYTYFWGGRSSCKRELLMTRGMFDPLFKFGCEDIELGFRLKESGSFKVVFNAAARSTMIRAVSLDDFHRRVFKQGQSNYVFSKKHPGEEIKAWANVHDLESRWENVQPRVDLIMNSARKLDAIANARLKEGLDLDDLTKALLHRSYWHSIDTELLRGSHKKMMDERDAIYTKAC